MAAPDESAFRFLDYVLSGFAGLLSLLWGFLTGRINRLEKAQDEFTKSHNALEVRIAGEYTPRRELETLGNRIFEKLDAIEKLLHQKADK